MEIHRENVARRGRPFSAMAVAKQPQCFHKKPYCKRSAALEAVRYIPTIKAYIL